MIINKCITIAENLYKIPNATKIHFSFLTYKSNILSIGWNDGWKTHTLAKKYGYRFDAIHSELNCIINYRRDKELLRKCTIVNIRINKFKQLRNSKPCHICNRLLTDTNISKVIYYDNNKWFHNEDLIKV